jgi:diacylglycerol O-acyltransferase / wax synthase
VPIAARVRITTGIFSYNGGMTFGINGDYDAVPDIAVFAHGIEAEIGDLLKLARP